MTGYYLSNTLFGEVSLEWTDPISGDRKQLTGLKENIPGLKNLADKKQMREIVNYLYQNRSKAFDFLQKSNPHHISPKSRKAMSNLREQVNRLHEHEEIADLTTFITFQIFPDLAGPHIAPDKQKPTSEKYYRLVDHLCNMMHQILNAELHPEYNLHLENL